MSEEAVETIKDPILEESAHAAKTFEQLMTLFTEMLMGYDGGSRQIKRAWLNTSLSPLNKEPLRYCYPEEQELFQMASNIEGVKLTLMVHGLADAGVLTIHKPLMAAVPKTASEAELNKLEGQLDREVEAFNSNIKGE